MQASKSLTHIGCCARKEVHPPLALEWGGVINKDWHSPRQDKPDGTLPAKFMEALKAEYDCNMIDSLAFFRNSNGIEVDLIHSRPEGRNIFEIKASMTPSRDLLKNTEFFSRKYGAASSAVIYAGEDCPEYLGSRFINFHGAYDCFAMKEEKFRLRLS